MCRAAQELLAQPIRRMSRPTAQADGAGLDKTGLAVTAGYSIAQCMHNYHEPAQEVLKEHKVAGHNCRFCRFGRMQSFAHAMLWHLLLAHVTAGCLALSELVHVLLDVLMATTAHCTHLSLHSLWSSGHVVMRLSELDTLSVSACQLCFRRCRRNQCAG